MNSEVVSERFLLYSASVQISMPPGSSPLTAAAPATEALQGLQVGSKSVPG